MNFSGILELKKELDRAPAKGKLLAAKIALEREMFNDLSPHLHEVSMQLLQKDIDKWDTLFIQYLKGDSTESDRLEMKCVLSRIQNTREAFHNYQKSKLNEKELR